MIQQKLYDVKGQYIGPSEATQHARIEYVNAGDDLFLPKLINGKSLCVQGRAYRAMKLACQAPPEQHADYYKACAELFRICDQKIEEYHRLAKLYIALCQFGGVEPEIHTWPDCQCEGCQMIRADEDFQERIFEYATKGANRQQPTGDRRKAA